MANTKSALKNIRKNKARYLRNRAITSKLKTLEKQFLLSIENKDVDDAKQNASSFISALEKANKNNIVHHNKVSRKSLDVLNLLAHSNIPSYM